MIQPLTDCYFVRPDQKYFVFFSGGQIHFKNDTGNGKIHNSSALSYHETTPHTSNTTSLNNEQSYARVVGQVSSGETVTKIYKDPQTFLVSCATSKEFLILCSF